MTREFQFSQRVLDVQESGTLACHAKTNELKRKGINIIGFGVGETDFDTSEHVKEAGIKAIRENFNKYTDVQGTLELRKAIVEKLKKENQITCEVENVIVSAGVRQGIYNALNVLLNNGDEVIIPRPYWVSYIEQVRLCGGNPVIVQTQEENKYKVTVKELAAVWSENTQALILCNPCNPTGAVYSQKELTEIAEWGLNNRVRIISDEVYEKFVYEGKHFSMASLGEEYLNNTVSVFGLGKSYGMTGWRIGYACTEPETIRHMNKVQGHSTGNACSISQKASLAALTGPQNGIGKMIEAMKKRRNVMMKKLGEIERITCVEPNGSIYVFPKVSAFFGNGIENATDMTNYLLDKAHVAVVAGEFFGCKENIRLSFSYNEGIIEEGLERIKKALNELK